MSSCEVQQQRQKHCVYFESKQIILMRLVIYSLLLAAPDNIWFILKEVSDVHISGYLHCGIYEWVECILRVT